MNSNRVVNTVESPIEDFNYCMHVKVSALIELRQTNVTFLVLCYHNLFCVMTDSLFGKTVRS